MFLIFLFFLSFAIGYLTMSFALKEEKVGVIFIQENNFDLPEQNSK